jgi:hypothetical protein
LVWRRGRGADRREWGIAGGLSYGV